MLLVLISLMAATVITAAYLASRDNSGAIGENVANAAAARWGAATGINLAASMLETETNWRSAHGQGVLLPNFAFAECVLDITLKDLETGTPPNANTTYLQVLSTADVGGIEHDASASMIVPVPGIANVDLSEFALFAAEEIELRDQARVTRWADAPLTRLNLPISMGSLSTDMGAITIRSDALAVDAVGWLTPGATATAVNNASVLDMHANFMADAITLPRPPSPPSGGLSIPFQLLTPGNHWVVLSLRSLLSIDISGVTTLNFDPGRVVRVSGDLRIKNNSTLRVSGDAVIIVDDDLIVSRTGGIELVGANSRLRIFVGGNAEIRGYIGEVNGQGGALHSSNMPYSDVTRVHLFNKGNSQRTWDISHDALVKGTIYAPNAHVRFSDFARLCGRIAASRIQVRDSAAIYYDHALDRRTGYTHPLSPIYDSDGRVKPAFKSLQSLNDSDLASLAASAKVKVRAVNREVGNNPATAPNIGLGQSTPRPIALTLVELTYDTALATWENE